ncbi:MAG: glycosyltransferase family 39 protein [Solirubrobacterales bacterium]|nr:glycosyltransferase family 39 protein [Solirubrobacterales bacterium]MBV9717001.1 glycosyltransferase family 39 protein [Solirubrobacterales bacterium]
MSTETVPAQASETAAPALRPQAAWRTQRLRISRLTAFAGVAVLILVSLLLRTRALHFHFWVDEGISVGIASHPLLHIPALLRQDGSPPLYYLLLHVWIAARGSTEVSTHELSLVFALLTIPVAYWAGASLFDRRAGLICAVLAAGVPYLTAYAQETRMYSLLALLGVIVAASFVHAFVFRRRRHLPVFAISLALALYTHNWALFLGLVSAITFVVVVFRAPRLERAALWRDGALAFGGTALLYAPWLPTLLYQSRHTGAPWDLPPVLWSLTQGTYSLVGGRGAAVALLLAGGSGLMTLRGSSPGRRRLALAALSLLLLGAGTLLIAWTYAKVTPAWADRYLAVVLAPLLLLFGLGVARAGRLGLVALALVASFWVLDPLPTSVDSKSNVGITMAKVRHHLGADPLVLSTQPEQVPVISYYLPGVSRFATPLGLVPDPRVMDWRDALRRFHRNSVRSVLLPAVRSLPPGTRVLLVTPLGMASKPLYMKLINRASVQWSTALAYDPALKRVKVTDAMANVAGVAVRAVLYEVRAHPATRQS